MKKAFLLFILSFLYSFSVQANDALRLATTTSTDNTGLLSTLIPAFSLETGIKVEVVAVGTGKALELARRGDADIVMVHARQAEDIFVARGFGVNRRDLMENDFILVGPSSDPALIRGQNNSLSALKKIAASQAIFISRGDNSGTHKKELSLWKHAGLKPASHWYKEVGQSMGKALLMANELSAYTLTDRGTWLAYQDKLSLQLLSEGGVSLKNPYGIIAVNPAIHPNIQYLKAMSLIAWLTAPIGQQLIGSFKRDGHQLFYPTAIKDTVLNE